MTNKEAIEILRGAIKKPNTKDGYLGQALDMAIKTLEKEPCEDCISRESVMVRVKEYFDNPSYDEKMLCDDLVNLPSVTSQPKMGEWFIDGSETNREVVCSNCDQHIFKYHKLDFDYRPNYCPNCGARMEIRK